MAIVTVYNSRQTHRGGVYALVNVVNSKAYIGSTNNLRTREAWHRWALRNTRHPNPHLQRAWNSYGESAFEFVVLERCEPAQLIRQEQWYIDASDACNVECGYNLSAIAGRVAMSEDVCKRISEARRGKAQRPKGFTMSPEHRAKIAAAHIGKKHPPRSESVRQTMREVAAARKARGDRVYFSTPESIAKMAATKRGRAHTAEHREKIGDGLRAAWAEGRRTKWQS